MPFDELWGAFDVEHCLLEALGTESQDGEAQT